MRTRYPQKFVLAVAAVAISATASSQSPDTINPDRTTPANEFVDQGWRLALTPTLWLPPVDGTEHKNGLAAEFEASQSERISNYQPSGELFIEYRNGDWSFVLQPQYAELDLDGQLHTPIGNLPLEIKSKSLLVEYWVSHRIGTEDQWVDVLVGGRYVEIDTVVNSVLGADGSVFDWHDPILGMRFERALRGRWRAGGMLTIAPFEGSSDRSTRSWEARASASREINDRWSVQAGYRYFKTKYVNSTNQSLLKYRLSGPFVSVTARVK